MKGVDQHQSISHVSYLELLCEESNVFYGSERCLSHERVEDLSFNGKKLGCCNGLGSLGVMPGTKTLGESR